MIKEIGKMFHYNTDRFDKTGPYKEFKLDYDHPFIDRYEVLHHYLPVVPYSKPLTYDRHFTKSFSDISDQSSTIILNSGKIVNIFWSGGLDSTTALVALLSNTKHKNQIKILASYNSILESGYFYETFLKPFNAIINTSAGKETFNEDELYVTGALGNQLFGTGAFDITEKHPENLSKKYEEVVDPKKIEFYYPVLKLAPRPIVTYEDFLWFESFAFKWDHQRFTMALKLFKLENCEKYIDIIKGFYYNEDYEQWSISNQEQHYDIKNFDVTTKMPMRKYILKKLGNRASDYCKHKKIIRSIFIPFSPTYKYVTTDFRVHYDTSL
jgi:hypothetical protein